MRPRELSIRVSWWDRGNPQYFDVTTRDFEEEKSASRKTRIRDFETSVLRPSSYMAQSRPILFDGPLYVAIPTIIYGDPEHRPNRRSNQDWSCCMTWTIIYGDHECRPNRRSELATVPILDPTLAIYGNMDPISGYLWKPRTDAYEYCAVSFFSIYSPVVDIWRTHDNRSWILLSIYGGSKTTGFFIVRYTVRSNKNIGSNDHNADKTYRAK